MTKSMKKLKASIIIPSIRPGTCKICVDRINETSKGIHYEIVVVSPYDMDVTKCDNVKFIQESAKVGNMAAERLGFQHCEGEYIMPIGDYFLFEKDCLKNMIEFCDKQPDIMILTSPKIHGFWNVQPECTVFGKYYPRLPFIHRKWLDKIGGLVDERYKYNHGDVDLAMRVYKNGGKVKPCPGAYTEVFDPTTEDIDNRAIPEHDGVLFGKIWVPVYGTLEDVPYPHDPYELSHELSHRVYTKFRHKEWNIAIEELKKDYTVSKRFFPWLVSYILLFWEDIPIPKRIPLLKGCIDIAKREHHWFYYNLFKNQVARIVHDIDGNSRILSMVVAAMLIFRVNEILGRGHLMMENFYDHNINSWDEMYKKVRETGHGVLNNRVVGYGKLINSITDIDKLAEINWDVDRRNYITPRRF